MPYQDVFAGQYAEQSWWQNHFLRAFADGVVEVSRFQEIVGVSIVHGKINVILKETPTLLAVFTISSIIFIRSV